MMMVMVTETDQTAPGRLELLRGFVNTLDVEHDDDALGDGPTASAWLAANGLAAPAGLRTADLERLVAVREALRRMLLANNAGERPPAAALATLNEQAHDAAVGLRFTTEGADLVTGCDGIDATIAELLAIVHGAMADGTWPRLKACPADDCLWAFYDHSRNRSGTWCEMGDCGNRAKARAYRERQRHQHGR